MNKLLSSFFFAVLLSSAGCQKQVDLGRLQEETLTSVKLYVSEIDTLQRRAEALLARGREVASAPGVNEAGKRLTEARARIEQLRGAAQSAPTSVAAAAKTGFEALKKTADQLVDKLGDDIAVVRADLEAVESWVASAERAPREIPQAPDVAAPGAEAPADEATNEATNDAANETTNEAAAPTPPTGAATPPAPARPASPAVRAPVTKVVAPAAKAPATN